MLHFTINIVIRRYYPKAFLIKREIFQMKVPDNSTLTLS